MIFFCSFRIQDLGFDPMSTLLVFFYNLYFLVIGAPTASYGVHTNAGAVHIFDSIYFTYLGKMHADRALARFGRSFTQSEDYVFIGAPRYHEVCIPTNT